MLRLGRVARTHPDVILILAKATAALRGATIGVALIDATEALAALTPICRGEAAHRVRAAGCIKGTADITLRKAIISDADPDLG